MKTRPSLVVFVCLLLALALPVAAHHTMAVYDSKKPLSLTGTITRIEWTNPHVRVDIDSKDPSGEVTHWRAEMATISCMVKHGISKETLTIGSSITMRESWRAKSGDFEIVVFRIVYRNKTYRALRLPGEPGVPPPSDSPIPARDFDELNECAP